MTQPASTAGDVPAPEHSDATRGPSARPTSILLAWEVALQRLAEETARALRYARPLSVVAIDLGGAGPIDREQLAATIGGALRLGDVVGWDGASAILAILPETAESAVNPANRLLRALDPIAPGARAGFAICPIDGLDAGALRACASIAAASAGPGAIARGDDAASRSKVEPRNLPEETARAASATPNPADPAAIPRFTSLYAEIDELTRTRMLEALAASAGARARAAALIGLPLRTFVTKMKELRIAMPIARTDRRSRNSAT